MPSEEMPDDIAALLRDRATDGPAGGAQARKWSKTTGRGEAREPGTAAATVASTAIAGFAAGLLCGMVGTYLAVTLLAAPPNVYVPLPAPVPAVQAAQTVAPVVPAPAAPPRILLKRAPVAPAIPVSPVPTSNTAERAMERAWLDAARTALAREDFDNATSNLETARERFPDGTLSEEREALAIHVLIARGDRTLAELAIDTFRARHPGSLFVLAIEDAMREVEAK